MNEADEKRRDDADRALAATIHLMTCHARCRCPRLAIMIERHLALVSHNPEAGEHVRDACRRLAAAWACVRAHDERAMCEHRPAGTARLH